MYQVDIFDKFGAILARFTFSNLFNALAWMVKHRTGKIITEMGTLIKAPVEWELTRLKAPRTEEKTLSTPLGDITDMVGVEPKSKSQARRLSAQRDRGSIGEPWLSGATEEYLEGKDGAK